MAALQPDRPYTLLPFAADPAERADGPPPVIHLRLRPQTLHLAQSASTLAVDVGSSSGSSALIINGTRHDLVHADETAATDLYSLTREDDRVLSRIGPIRDRLVDRPSDISAVGQRIKERREEEAARRAEHRTVLLDTAVPIGKRPGGASALQAGSSSSSSSAAVRSSSLNSLNRTARQGSEAPSSLLRSPVPRPASTRPNLITAESIKAASPAPSSIASNPSPSKNDALGSGASTPTLGGIGSYGSAPASPYSSTRFSLRTRLVQFLALGPKPRRQIVAALGAPETHVLALLQKVADRPSELQPPDAAGVRSSGSSPALGVSPALHGSPQLGGSARFAGPVNRRVTNVAPPPRPQGHLSPSTVYVLKDGVYLDEVNIASWAAYTPPERRLVSKHALAAFKRMGVSAENDPQGWSKLYPDGWPTEAELRREREQEELDRDPNFAMRDDEVLSEIDSDELEREFGHHSGRNASQPAAASTSRGASSNGVAKRRRGLTTDSEQSERDDDAEEGEDGDDIDDGDEHAHRITVESSSDLSDVPDTLAPLPPAEHRHHSRGGSAISGAAGPGTTGRTPPSLSSSSSSSSLGAPPPIASLKTLSASASMPSMSSAASNHAERPPPKKKGLSTLERISRAAKGKGPSASERDRQIEKARKKAAAVAAAAAAASTNAAGGGGASASQSPALGSTSLSKAAKGALASTSMDVSSSQETLKSKGGRAGVSATSSASTAASKRGHAQQSSLPSMDFSMLHEVGRLRQLQQEGRIGAQELRRSTSLNQLERRGAAGPAGGLLAASSTASLAPGGSRAATPLGRTSVSPSASTSSKLAPRPSKDKAMASTAVASSSSSSSKAASASKKLKKRPQRRDIEFTDSSDEDNGIRASTSKSTVSTTAVKAKKKSSGAKSGAMGAASSRSIESPVQRWKSLHRDERAGTSSADERGGPSKSRKDVRTDSSVSRSSSKSTVKESGKSSSLAKSGAAYSKSMAGTKANGSAGASGSLKRSVLSEAEREALTLPGSMVRSHRAVAPGTNASAEPWLELRTVGDWHLLAERFLRVYGLYRHGRETVDRERERLVAEMEAAEREAEARARRHEEEQRRMQQHQQQSLIHVQTQPPPSSQVRQPPPPSSQPSQPAAASTSAGATNVAGAKPNGVRAESPEEGEMTPEDESAPLPPAHLPPFQPPPPSASQPGGGASSSAAPPPPSSGLVHKSSSLSSSSGSLVNSVSALGLDMTTPPPVSSSLGSRSASGGRGSQDGNGSGGAARGTEDAANGTNGPLLWRPNQPPPPPAPAEPEPFRGRLGPSASLAALRTGGPPPPSASLSSSTSSPSPHRPPSASRLGTSGPMPLAELERLVGQCKTWQGELYRMKRALVQFKRKIEVQEGRASESEPEAEEFDSDAGGPGGASGAGGAGTSGAGMVTDAVMGLGLDTSSAARDLDSDGDVRMG